MITCISLNKEHTRRSAKGNRSHNLAFAFQEQEHLNLPDVAAYIVVYAMNDRSSFLHAVEILQDIRKVEDKGAAVILVANKSDLVRKRKVNSEGEWIPRGERARVVQCCSVWSVKAAFAGISCIVARVGYWVLLLRIFFVTVCISTKQEDDRPIKTLDTTCEQLTF